MNPISIIEYSLEHQPGIDQMMMGIEKEFSIPITSPQSTRIHEVYQLPDQKFWVALHGNKVVGTIGLSLFSSGFAVLKRMMVDKNYRGKNSIASGFNTAGLLLNISLHWAKDKGFKKIYLGTMDQFDAAKKFYEKNGFKEIKKENIPLEYKTNPIDTVYYSKEI